MKNNNKTSFNNFNERFKEFTKRHQKALTKLLPERQFCEEVIAENKLNSKKISNSLQLKIDNDTRQDIENYVVEMIRKIKKDDDNNAVNDVQKVLSFIVQEQLLPTKTIRLLSDQLLNKKLKNNGSNQNSFFTQPKRSINDLILHISSSNKLSFEDIKEAVEGAKTGNEEKAIINKKAIIGALKTVIELNPKAFLCLKEKVDLMDELLKLGFDVVDITLNYLEKKSLALDFVSIGFQSNSLNNLFDSYIKQDEQHVRNDNKRSSIPTVLEGSEIDSEEIKIAHLKSRVDFYQNEMSVQDVTNLVKIYINSIINMRYISDKTIESLSLPKEVSTLILNYTGKKDPEGLKRFLEDHIFSKRNLLESIKIVSTLKEFKSFFESKDRIKFGAGLVELAEKTKSARLERLKELLELAKLTESDLTKDEFINLTNTEKLSKLLKLTFLTQDSAIKLSLLFNESTKLMGSEKIAVPDLYKSSNVVNHLKLYHFNRLKSLNDSEKLNEFLRLTELNELKKLENLKDIQELEKLIESENLTESDKDSKLKELKLKELQLKEVESIENDYEDKFDLSSEADKDRSAPDKNSELGREKLEILNSLSKNLTKFINKLVNSNEFNKGESEEFMKELNELNNKSQKDFSHFIKLAANLKNYDATIKDQNDYDFGLLINRILSVHKKLCENIELIENQLAKELLKNGFNAEKELTKELIQKLIGNELIIPNSKYKKELLFLQKAKLLSVDILNIVDLSTKELLMPDKSKVQEFSKSINSLSELAKQLDANVINHNNSSNVVKLLKSLPDLIDQTMSLIPLAIVSREINFGKMFTTSDKTLMSHAEQIANMKLDDILISDKTKIPNEKFMNIARQIVKSHKTIQETLQTEEKSYKADNELDESLQLKEKKNLEELLGFVKDEVEFVEIVELLKDLFSELDTNSQEYKDLEDLITTPILKYRKNVDSKELKEHQLLEERFKEIEELDEKVQEKDLKDDDTQDNNSDRSSFVSQERCGSGASILSKIVNYNHNINNSLQRSEINNDHEERNGQAIEFEDDDECEESVVYKPSNSPKDALANRMQTLQHEEQQDKTKGRN